VRDVAVWVPEGVTWEDIHTLAQRITSPLIVRIDCFDTFTKDLDGIKKTSFAFRFVLQSHERTLTDDEANKVADEMYALLKEKGYEIR
jgi:phenylalanyl-tRNA synthetase beta subunit